MIVEEKGNETAFYNALSCTKAIRLSQGYWPLLYLVSNLNDYEISIKKVTNLFLKLDKLSHKFLSYQMSILNF